MQYLMLSDIFPNRIFVYPSDIHQYVEVFPEWSANNTTTHTEESLYFPECLTVSLFKGLLLACGHSYERSFSYEERVRDSQYGYELTVSKLQENSQVSVYICRKLNFFTAKIICKTTLSVDIINSWKDLLIQEIERDLADEPN